MLIVRLCYDAIYFSLFNFSKTLLQLIYIRVFALRVFFDGRSAVSI